jgi:uncharacterized transporter YbjL
MVRLSIVAWRTRIVTGRVDVRQDRRVGRDVAKVERDLDVVRRERADVELLAVQEAVDAPVDRDAVGGDLDAIAGIGHVVDDERPRRGPRARRP